MTAAAYSCSHKHELFTPQEHNVHFFSPDRPGSGQPPSSCFPFISRPGLFEFSSSPRRRGVCNTHHRVGELEALGAARRIILHGEKVLEDQSAQVNRQRLFSEVHGKHCVQDIEGKRFSNHSRDLD